MNLYERRAVITVAARSEACAEQYLELIRVEDFGDFGLTFNGPVELVEEDV